jgi:hypothetical protein
MHIKTIIDKESVREKMGKCCLNCKHLIQDSELYFMCSIDSDYVEANNVCCKYESKGENYE